MHRNRRHLEFIKRLEASGDLITRLSPSEGAKLDFFRGVGGGGGGEGARGGGGGCIVDMQNL